MYQPMLETPLPTSPPPEDIGEVYVNRRLTKIPVPATAEKHIEENASELTWQDYPLNLNTYIPILDYDTRHDEFFTYKSLFSHTTDLDVFEVRDGIAEYKSHVNDQDVDEMIASSLCRPELRVIFLARDTAGIVGGGRYRINVDTTKRIFTYDEVPMSFLREHSWESEMTWYSESRSLPLEAHSLESDSLEFWYNSKLRIRGLRGKGEDKLQHMSVYHKYCPAKGATTIYCIGADDVIKDEFKNLDRRWPHKDMFVVHMVFLKRILHCYIRESKLVREIVRILTLNQSPQGLLSDPQLSRYMHGKTETSSILEHELDLLNDVLHLIQKHHDVYVFTEDEYVAHRVRERLNSMIATTKNLKRWCQKCHVMMQGQLSLAYSSISQADSRANIQIALLAQKDSRTMRIISFVTIFFLPPTAVGTVFGTNFFSFQNSTFETSPKIWIFFLSSVIVTILLGVAWLLYHHLDHPDPIGGEGTNKNGNWKGPLAISGPMPPTASRGMDGAGDDDSLWKYQGRRAGTFDASRMSFAAPKGLLRSFTARDLTG